MTTSDDYRYFIGTFIEKNCPERASVWRLLNLVKRLGIYDAVRHQTIGTQQYVVKYGVTGDGYRNGRI